MTRAKALIQVAILFAISVVTLSPQARPEPQGSWLKAATPPILRWELVLREDGPGRLVGAVSSCSSVQGAFEIVEGKIDGNTITFKCRSEDGLRTMSFRGVISGEEIVLTWEKQVQGGDTNGGRRFRDGFDDSAAGQFTVVRRPALSGGVARLANSLPLHPAVTFDRILHADREPRNWLTYSGTMRGDRHSRLTQITPANVKSLELAWLWQAQSQEKFEATSLVVDGFLYTVQAPNDVVALDATTGRKRWIYSYTPKNFNVCCGNVNRGLAIHGDTLFMGTLDAHLLAIDATTGKLVWDKTVANSADPACGADGDCYAINHAPLVVKDKVIVGTAGGDGPTRAFIAAFDVKTGREAWRFYTIPAPGEPGSETWSGDSWKTGGAAVWVTGAYDSDLNLTYWGTGNPHPTRPSNVPSGVVPSTRLGDNLYSDSVVALDADTGTLKWYYQFTPHDDMDWDSAQVPVLADIQWQGRPRKVMLWANRNGLLYVLDRTTGQFLMGKPFVEVNWMDGFDDKGRPMRRPGMVAGGGIPISPGAGTNWWSPSYSSSTGLLYVPASERGYGAIRAFEPQTGDMKWQFRRDAVSFSAGVLTTASDLLFTGVSYGASPEAARLVDNYFFALNARTGELLWQMGLAGGVQSGPMTYSVGGKQFIAVAAGNTLFAFALRQ